MKVCVVILVLYLLTCEQVLVQSSNAAKSAKSANCPKDLACDKLGADCMVTVEDFENNIVNRDWSVIWAVAFPPLPELGKVKIKWTQPQSGDTVTRHILIPSVTTCTAPEVFNLTIADNTDCGIELNEVNDGPRIDTFCSQNTTEYVLSYVCVAQDEEGCTVWFNHLLVRDPDTTNLPWAQINQDWFKFICTYFPDAPFPEYIWTNNECNFAT